MLCFMLVPYGHYSLFLWYMMASGLLWHMIAYYSIFLYIMGGHMLV